MAQEFTKKKPCYININLKKKWLSGKVDLEAKKIIRAKEGQYKMIKQSTYREDIATQCGNNRVSKY